MVTSATIHSFNKLTLSEHSVIHIPEWRLVLMWRLQCTERWV